jgi:hypothetical protein
MNLWIPYRRDIPPNNCVGGHQVSNATRVHKTQDREYTAKGNGASDRRRSHLVPSIARDRARRRVGTSGGFWRLSDSTWWFQKVWRAFRGLEKVCDVPIGIMAGSWPWNSPWGQDLHANSERNALPVPAVAHREEHRWPFGWPRVKALPVRLRSIPLRHLNAMDRQHFTSLAKGSRSSVPSHGCPASGIHLDTVSI